MSANSAVSEQSADTTQSTALHQTQIDAFVADSPAWSLVDGKLCACYEFIDFVAAFAFMSAVACEAERLGHHPDWRNVYRTVEISLWTHDVGAITALDLDLAQRIAIRATTQLSSPKG
jgi:4a-hydroxytetrahydrobiopterin dehydratase